MWSSLYPTQVFSIAERIRQAIALQVIDFPPARIQVTSSVGVLSIEPGGLPPLDVLIKRASLFLPSIQRDARTP